MLVEGVGYLASAPSATAGLEGMYQWGQDPARKYPLKMSNQTKVGLPHAYGPAIYEKIPEFEPSLHDRNFPRNMLDVVEALGFVPQATASRLVGVTRTLQARPAVGADRHRLVLAQQDRGHLLVRAQPQLGRHRRPLRADWETSRRRSSRCSRRR